MSVEAGEMHPYDLQMCILQDLEGYVSESVLEEGEG